MSKVLVTGFGPYGVTPVNPAQLTAEELDGRTIAGATVISRIVPNTFFESIAAAQQAIAEIEPALVIMLGEYPGRSMITALGNEIVAFVLKNATRFGMQDVIWRGAYYTPNGARTTGAGHYDHIHITTVGGGYPTGEELYIR